jgi:uncharacterized protein YyaL (SSP411 family)
MNKPWGVVLGLLSMAALPGQEHGGGQAGQGDRQEPRPANRLDKESSPYLRQHRHNPVDWHPWGDEALALAKKLDKPIFLSIGYSACHWCHVMAAESFSDPEVAKLMNEKFVCIKVDREERPDIDQIYMGALHAMGKQGGWPLSAWLTPDGKPFFGGTYFPPTASRGLPSFRLVCESLANAWADERDKVLQGAGELSEHLEQALAPSLPAGEPTPALFGKVLAEARDWYDAEHPGFAAPPRFAPKFPQASQLQMLLRNDDQQGRAMALAALRAMARGGIHDQLGGGFHRYSTDRRWLVPHFEKMLYDNALLASAYLEASQLEEDGPFANVARSTLDYLLREMQAPDGGFWSSQDAQSEGVEGKFFVWSRAEIEQLLGDDAELVCDVFGVTAAGNWDGTNVLWQAQDVPATEAFAAARARLFAARAERVRPGTDDKVLVAWNGMAIEALCDGYRVLGDRRYLEAAQRAGAFLLERCVVDGRVRRSWQGGSAPFAGYLEDHASLANALLALFESDFEGRWLRAAKQVLQTTRDHFRAEDGSFYFTADDHEQLLARTKSASEGATPSGIAMAARAFLRAGLLLGDDAVYQLGAGALRANHALLAHSPASAPALMRAVQLHLGAPKEIVIAGRPDDARTQALLRAAWRRFPQPGVVACVHNGNREALVAISKVFDGKLPRDGAPCAYVCERGVCQAPVTTVDALRQAWAAAKPAEGGR